jgi:predicted metal-dependent hydrolase
MRRDIATEHIQKLLDEGKSYGQVSRELGISRAAIHKRLKKVMLPPVTSDEKVTSTSPPTEDHPLRLSYNERMEILRKGGTIQDSEEVTPVTSSDSNEKVTPSPVTSSEEEHLQNLFHQTMEQYFPEHLNDSWTLVCFPNEEEWNQKLEKIFPGENISKIEASSNYETRVVSVPSFKYLPDQIWQALLIHEFCHLVVKEKGHGKDFCFLMVKIMEKVLDPFVHTCLELQLSQIVVKGLLPLLKQIQKPAKPKKVKPKERELLRFPKRYRSRHLEDLIKGV